MVKRIFGFGALNVDLIFEVLPSTAHNLPYEPGFEYFAAHSEVLNLLNILKKEGSLQGKYGGGSAANTVAALSRLGFPCSFIGKVGEDEEGDFLLESLEGVYKGDIVQKGSSGLCITLLLGSSRDRSMIISPNTNDTLGYEDISVEKVCAEACWVHFTSFNGDRPFKAQCRLAGELPPEVKVSFDPGMFYARRGLLSLKPLLKRTDYFFPEKKEVEILTGSSWEQGSRELLKWGPKAVLCTMGEKGVFVVSELEEFHVPAPKVTVVDTTGAGDVFAAGFIAGRLKGKNLKESVKDGVLMAAGSITGMGREKYPER